jgi:hypothetical protein
MGQCGIEIHVGLTSGQRTIGKVLSALHLQKLGEWIARLDVAVIVVDGQRREEPLYEAHFVEVGPGEHTVEMWLQGADRPIAVGSGLSRSVWGKTITVEVEDASVTTLLYTPRDGGGATLEVTGTRRS